MIKIPIMENYPKMKLIQQLLAKAKGIGLVLAYFCIIALISQFYFLQEITSLERQVIEPG